MNSNLSPAYPNALKSLPTGPARPENGFTLIEIVLVMSIFSIGILAIMTLHVGAISSNARARDILMGSTLLSDQFEKLISADYAGTELDPGEITQHAGDGCFAEHTIFATPIPNIKKIDLTITLDTASTRSFKVSYYKRNPD